MYLYLVMAENGLFKMGKTWRLNNRIAQIRTASPIACELFCVIEYDEREGDAEKIYHNMFANRRVRGEWFALSKGDLLKIAGESMEIRELLDHMQSWGCFSPELNKNGITAAMMRMSVLKDKNFAFEPGEQIAILV
jgi:hypothetical protein